MNTHILQQNFNFLRIYKVWPKKGRELTKRKEYYRNFFIAAALSCNILIGSFLHLCFVTLRDPDLLRWTEDLVWIVLKLGLFYFSITFVLNQKRVAKALLLLSDFNTFGQPPLHDQYSKAAVFRYNLSDSFAVYLLIGILFLWNIVTFSHCHNLNAQRRIQDVCGLLAPAFWPFNFDYFPVKQLLMVWQLYSLTWTCRVGAALSLLMMEILEHLVCRIEHLKSMIPSIVDEDDPGLQRKKFRNWLRYHQFIYRIGDQLNKSFSPSLFLHVTISGVSFGLIAFLFTVGISPIPAAILVGWSISFVIVCYGGQRIMEASQSVGLELWESNWASKNIKAFKDFQFIMQRSQERQIGINAGPIAQMNMGTIIRVCQTAYSYMGLMRALRQ